MRPKLFIQLTSFATLLTLSSPAAVITYGPISYQSRTQSPFYEGISSGSFVFESFEDMTVDLPGAAFLNTVEIQDTFRPSIDEDDGILDGRGRGRSLVSGQILNEKSFILTFQPNTIGQYPRYFGVAFPRPVSRRPGVFEEILGVTNALSNAESLYTFPTPAAITGLPGDTAYYGTFIGIFDDRGITQITFSNAAYIDHVQYGYAIPEVGSASLAGSAGIFLALRRRKR